MTSPLMLGRVFDGFGVVETCAVFLNKLVGQSSRSGTAALLVSQDQNHFLVVVFGVQYGLDGGFHDVARFVIKSDEDSVVNLAEG